MEDLINTFSQSTLDDVKVDDARTPASSDVASGTSYYFWLPLDEKKQGFHQDLTQKKAKKKKRKAKKINQGKKNFEKKATGNDLLQRITGITEGTRSDFIKLVWKYAHDKNLSKGQYIQPDLLLSQLASTTLPFNGILSLSKFIGQNLID